MIEFFRSTVIQVINNRCHCNISVSFIYAEELWCDITAPSHVIYHATSDSIGEYSSVEIVSFIDEWIRGGANLTNGINLVTFESECTVLINQSDPPCNASTQEQPTLSTSEEQIFTTTSIALCAVVGLLVLALVAGVIGVSVMCWYCSRRQTLISKMAGDPPLRQR